MANTVAILQKGYFPTELPPPFQTQMFGELVKAKKNSFPKEFNGNSNSSFISHSCNHNLARPGTLRRELQMSYSQMWCMES